MMSAKRTGFYVMICSVALIFSGVQPVCAKWGELLDTLTKAAGQNDSLSTGEIVDGLKEALEIGTDNAVKAGGERGWDIHRIRKSKFPFPVPLKKSGGCSGLWDMAPSWTSLTRA